MGLATSSLSTTKHVVPCFAVDVWWPQAPAHAHNLLPLSNLQRMAYTSNWLVRSVGHSMVPCRSPVAGFGNTQARTQHGNPITVNHLVQLVAVQRLEVSAPLSLVRLLYCTLGVHVELNRPEEVPPILHGCLQLAEIDDAEVRKLMALLLQPHDGVRSLHCKAHDARKLDDISAS